ncbi:protein BatD [Parashewanella spongiae]|uniref:Protein BatD n=1 Tax=Parashewanella spongiae TaxID=342950 RepID=A0A3A6UJ53_9GAMM|nr:BatD family protein [Parashewanella spongiae]MCL1076889.1 BatD family protein [Parashewanella spongiae]RJY19139.1 protein BatD [Parashewanella spongiae]
MVNRLIVIFLLLSSYTGSAFAVTKVEASVDRNPVAQGQYFALSIVVDDEVSGESLKTTSLLKDFIVGRTNVSRSTQIVNFNTAKETRWQILLAAKKKGIATIPSFTIDGVSSNPIALQVVSGNSPTSNKNDDVYIETELSHDQSYVGQLLLYKVKLFLAVDLQRGVLNAPLAEGAQVKQIGEDQDGTEIVNGRRFRVIKRTYGIIADKAGDLRIQSASFKGDVLVNTQQRRSMFSFNESRPVEIGTTTNTVKVLEKPAGYQGNWLVSDLVLLNEEWPQEQEEYELGAPITRTLKLLASNADDNSLPSIHYALPDSLKSYPEKPVRKTYVRNGNMVAELSLTEAIIPTKPGKFTLPELKVPWWNPQLKRQEYAVLPARTIMVKGGILPATIPTNSIPASDIQVENQYSAGYWPWATLLFACLWLVTLVTWFTKKPLTSEIKTTPATSSSLPLSHIEKEMKQAIKLKNYSAVLNAIQNYFSQKQNKNMNLTEITALSPLLAQIINKLQMARFGQKEVEITEQELSQAVKSAIDIQQNGQKSALIDLNP